MLMINLLSLDAPERKLARQRVANVIAGAKYRATEKGKAAGVAAQKRRREDGRQAIADRTYRERNLGRALERDRLAKKRERQIAPEKLRARNQAWREANPSYALVASKTAKAWRHANMDRARRNHTAWLKRNPAYPTINRLQRFKLSVLALVAMLQQQGHRCAICRQLLQGGRRQHVDHDHATGAVRGVLCCDCNSGIGKLRDDPVVIARALEYVRRGGMP